MPILRGGSKNIMYPETTYKDYEKRGPLITHTDGQLGWKGPIRVYQFV